MTEYSSLDETKDLDQESSANAYSAMEQQRMSRRRLLSLVGTGGGAVVATTILAACSMPGSSTGTATSGSSTTKSSSSKSSSSSSNSSGSQASGNVLAQASDIPVNSAKTFPIAGQQNPGIIVHLSSGSFVAYDSTCTHQQCAVQYNPSDMLLECPCHGAAFDPANNGAVTQGPATSPLTAIQISVSSSGAITRSS